MRFSILRFVSYIATLAYDRSLWRMRWTALSARQQYQAQLALVCGLILLMLSGAWNQNLLTMLGFLCEVSGLLCFLATCWRGAPLLTARLRQHLCLTAALLAVNVIAIYKMPSGQRSISMATSSIAVIIAYIILSKLGRICGKICCCCYNCCRDVCTDAGDLPKLPPAVS